MNDWKGTQFINSRAEGPGESWFISKSRKLRWGTKDRWFWRKILNTPGKRGRENLVISERIGRGRKWMETTTKLVSTTEPNLTELDDVDRKISLGGKLKKRRRKGSGGGEKRETSHIQRICQRCEEKP